METCVNWDGVHSSNGYAMFGSRLAHRATYEAVTGESLGRDEVDHMCGNTSCIRPTHLMRVPAGWNAAQGLRNRHQAQREMTECRNGHSLSDAMVRNATGTRICRTCFNARRRKWRASRAA